MSNFVTERKHPTAGDMRKCLALDDCFGWHHYGFWFVKKDYTGILNWSTAHKNLESKVYDLKGKSLPAPKKPAIPKSRTTPAISKMETVSEAGETMSKHRNFGETMSKGGLNIDSTIKKGK